MFIPRPSQVMTLLLIPLFLLLAICGPAVLLAAPPVSLALDLPAWVQMVLLALVLVIGCADLLAGAARSNSV